MANEPPLIISCNNLFNAISSYESVHDGDNLSDHSVLILSLQLPVEYGVESSSNIRTPYVVWSKAN